MAADKRLTNTAWWAREVHDGRVKITHDLYWLLRDLARQEGLTPEEFRALDLFDPADSPHGLPRYG